MVRGLIAFPITPMSDGGIVDSGELRHLVGRLVESGVDAICVLGSTGSYPYLEREQRRRTIESAASEINGRLPLIAGTGALRTDMAVHLTQDARAAGAVAGLLAPIAYTPLTEDEVFVHFETVADLGGLPLCIYDNPAATHFEISDKLLTRLMTIPGMIAAKLPATSCDFANRLARLRPLAPPDFAIGFSGDAHAPEALAGGADAWFSVLAGLFPAPAVAISRAAAAGDIDQVRALARRLDPLWQLFRDYGSIRVIYSAANLAGICSASPPRPVLPMPQEGRDRLKAMLDQLISTSSWL